MQIYDLILKRGDTCRRQFDIWNADKTEPLDMTGITVASEIRVASGASPVVVLPLEVVDSSILLHIAPELSRGLPARALWDLQFTYASGDVTTVLGGDVRVKDDITDSGA